MITSQHRSAGFIVDMARDTHETLVALAGANDYGLGVLTFTSY